MHKEISIYTHSLRFLRSRAHSSLFCFRSHRPSARFTAFPPQAPLAPPIASTWHTARRDVGWDEGCLHYHLGHHGFPKATSAQRPEVGPTSSPAPNVSRTCVPQKDRAAHHGLTAPPSPPRLSRINRRTACSPEIQSSSPSFQSSLASFMPNFSTRSAHSFAFACAAASNCGSTLRHLLAPHSQMRVRRSSLYARPSF